MKERKLVNSQISCNRCILDSSTPGIYFDEKKICNYCKLHDKLEQKYALNEINKYHFSQLLKKIKSKGKNKKYDCIVGVSGGTDSTFCLYMAKKLGLRPLALHFDNGWVSEIAKNNIKKFVKTLNIDLKVVKLNWGQLKNYYLAFLKASVPEICLACEIGIVSSIYETAAEENISYIILGTSFRTEGIFPLRWHYIDGAYFEDIIKRFGNIDPEIKKFNRTKLFNMFNYIFLKKIKTVQLPLYINYNDRNIRETLTKELEWEYGGRHHFDCLFKPFQSYFCINKFKIDHRKIGLSALVRSKEITKDEALNILEDDSFFENKENIEYCIQKLGITHEEFQNILSLEPKTFLHYRTYYPIIKRLRIPVKKLVKLNLLPETFYEKFFELV